MIRVLARQLQFCLQRHTERKTSFQTFLNRISWSVDVIVQELQNEIVTGVFNGEILCKDLEESIVLTLLGRRVELQEISERLQLYIQEIRIGHRVLYRCEVNSVVYYLRHL